MGFISVYRNVFLVFCPIILFYYDISVTLFCVQKSFSSCPINVILRHHKYISQCYNQSHVIRRGRNQMYGHWVTSQFCNHFQVKLWERRKCMKCIEEKKNIGSHYHYHGGPTSDYNKYQVKKKKRKCKKLTKHQRSHFMIHKLVTHQCYNQSQVTKRG